MFVPGTEILGEVEFRLKTGAVQIKSGSISKTRRKHRYYYGEGALWVIHRVALAFEVEVDPAAVREAGSGQGRLAHLPGAEQNHGGKAAEKFPEARKETSSNHLENLAS